MDRKPGKRRSTQHEDDQFRAAHAPRSPSTPKKPYTLGRMWQDQHEPQGSQGSQRRAHDDSWTDSWTDSWLVREPEAPGPSPERPANWELAPTPADPFAPEVTGFAPAPEDSVPTAGGATGDSLSRLDGDAPTIPLWGQSDAQPTAHVQQDHPDEKRRRALLGQLAARVRRPRLMLALMLAGRPRLMLAAVAGVLVLCVAVGAMALSNASRGPGGVRGASGAQSAVHAAATLPTPTVAKATPKPTTAASPAPTSTDVPTPLTLAVTCASGVANGDGQLCVHTLPHAALSLTVRYCDGTVGKGKAFHGETYADASGNYTWSWTVTSTCVGTASATVTAKSAGQTVTQNTTFAVTR